MDDSFKRPWSGDRRSLETPHFTQSLSLTLGVREKGIYLRCPGPKSLPALASGVAKYLPAPITIRVLRSDRVATADAADITRRLQAGESVILAREGPSDLLVELANQWAECTSFADGSTFVYAGFVLKADENAGFLAIVHAADAELPLPRKATICRVPPEEVATLEILGNASLIAVGEVG